ncbi:MAG: glucosamine-6-phosphate deaminase [Phycisphaeraceae bacterium]
MTTMPDQLMQQQEKLPTVVFDHAHDASVAVAREIAKLIRDRAANGQTTVLGLATGSTPTRVYSELIRMHEEEGLSFQSVVTFNLDEYYPIQPEALQSYNRFMRENLFDHIDVKPENIHIPDGTVDIHDVPDYCARYEQQIKDAGGLDLQLLGIGRTGHIGFNEPGSPRNCPTRLISLDRITRLDAASDFFGEENVPRRAITMGVGSILNAKRVVIMAFGEGKAPVVRQAVEGPITESIPATFLQEHVNASFVMDRAASEQLTRNVTPWKVGPVAWDEKIIRKAVTWLARSLQKPILKLTDGDYNENHLQDLLAEHGPAYDINLHIFRIMQRSISGWPGGKDPAHKQPGDLDRPTDRIFPKRVLIFSPHPDDDVISMGGTLLRLVDHGHEVHVAYQVSGSIAVSDEDAIRFADFAADFNRIFDIDQKQSEQIESHIEQVLKNKKPGQVDSEQVQQIKTLIRRGEARAASRYCGVAMENLHFLDMPFYETGTVRKSPLGEADIDIITDLLEKVQPHQIYAAGDLSDPHGTHRVCLTAILQALESAQQKAWFKENLTELWLYRGAWHEWEPEQIEMAVPLSPQELMRKRTAIFKHESQKDKALFPGSDPREFWQRAEDRNKATARLYDQLGLPEFEAIEGFVQWDGNTDI